MILPMKKVTFLVYHRDYNRFLNELHDLGAVHVIKADAEERTELRNQRDNIEKHQEAIRSLKSMKIPAGAPKNDIDADKLLELMANMSGEKDRLNQNLTAYLKEIASLEPWGDFSWETLGKLKEAGLEPEFFACLRSKFHEEWIGEYPLAVVNTVGTYYYFVLFRPADETIVLDAERMKLPTRSISELNALKSAAERRIAEIDTFLKETAASRIHVLETHRNHLLDQFDFEEAKLSSSLEMEDRLVILRGWVTKEQESGLAARFEKDPVVWFSEEPAEGDNVPVKLRNNWYTRLFEPIGKLYSLPSYAELDLTACFAPFFMLFFGVCTADGGYGALLLAAAVFGLFKVKNKALKPILWLLMFLSVSTMINGLAQGSIFAFQIKPINIYMRLFHLQSPDDVTGLLFNQALLLGVIQVLFGVAVNFYSRIRNGFIHGLSTLGVFIILFCLSVMGAPMMAKDPVAFKASLGVLNQVVGIVIWPGLFLVFFFNSPGKNVFVNFALGFWEMYNIVTGFFGDLLSYIRLFALGVSGAILGMVINSMANQFGGMVPVVGTVIWLMIMVIGHPVNIALGSLGGFVHPMRLTFVEFYKNSGFSGGGIEFKPFAKKR
jgi:V/A-type H+/Na+-transporting ATPase subunit I